MIHNPQCPNCKGFKTASVSPKRLARIVGLGGILVGLGTLIFVIGFLIFPIGVFFLFMSFFLKDTNEYRCRTCGCGFDPNSNVVPSV